MLDVLIGYIRRILLFKGNWNTMRTLILEQYQYEQHPRARIIIVVQESYNLISCM